MVEKKEILNVIKGLKGASNTEIMGIFPEEPSFIFDDFLDELIKSGLITHFKGVYYPIVRSIGIIPKGKNKTIDEIELTDLSVEEIAGVFNPNDDDPLFYDGYQIDESKVVLFKRFDNIRFDFKQFDYYLLCGFDNSRPVHNPS